MTLKTNNIYIPLVGSLRSSITVLCLQYFLPVNHLRLLKHLKHLLSFLYSKYALTHRGVYPPILMRLHLFLDEESQMRGGSEKRSKKSQY